MMKLKIHINNKDTAVIGVLMEKYATKSIGSIDFCCCCKSV